MKLLGLVAAGLGVALGNTCAENEYYSYNMKSCRPAPQLGERCNFVRTCAGDLTCDDRICKDFIDPEVMPKRWGVHFHFLPTDYREAVRSIVVPEGDQGATAVFEALIPNFGDIDRAIVDADELNIQKITMSCPTGTQYFNQSEALRWTQNINDVMAAAAAKYPERVSFFAHLPPFTDEEGVLSEIERVTSTYGNYKFGLLTQYPETPLSTIYDDTTHRILVADPQFAPIWEKLNEIKAIVTIHPTELAIGPEQANNLTPHPSMDYAYDTARMAHNIVTNGVKKAYSDVQIIITHGGGEYPVTNFRACAIAVQLQFQYRCFGLLFDAPCMMAPDDLGIFRVLPDSEPQYELEVAEMQETGRTFWYDLSLTTGPSLVALLDYLGPENHNRIFYGSDAGYVSPWETGLFYKDMVKSLNKMDPDSINKFELNDDIQFNNAEAFFGEYDMSVGDAKI